MTARETAGPMPGRLLSASYPGGINYSYTYDAAGNRLTSNEAGTAKTYTYNVDNQLTAVNSNTYTYDNNGNLVNNGTRSFTYDYDDYAHLARVGEWQVDSGDEDAP